MNTKTSTVKRAAMAVARAMGAKRYGVHGKPFICQMCGHDRFKLGSGASLVGLYSLACAECSHVEFFAQSPPVLDENAA